MSSSKHAPSGWRWLQLRRILCRIEQGWSPECFARSAEGDEWGVLKAGCTNHGKFAPAENKALPPDLKPIAALEIRDGDLLMSRASGSPKFVGSTAFVSNPPRRLMLSDKIFRLEVDPRTVNKHFLAYVLGSSQVRAQIEASISGAEGLANNLPQSAVRGLAFMLPDIERQAAIASLLDRKTGAIDALITRKEQFLAVLQEKRRALIAGAVTHGSVVQSLLPSRCPWLPQIPRSWKVAPLKRLLSLGPKNGISPPPASEMGVLSFSISAVRNGRVNVAGHEKYVELEPHIVSDFAIRRDDILVIRGNGNLELVGTCGLVTDAPSECTYPDILMLMRASHLVRPDFLVAAINSPYVRAQIEVFVRTSNGAFKVSGEDVKNLQIAVPPRDEQDAIMGRIEVEAGRLERLIAFEMESISRLREYRQTLITAAVTGRIDIVKEAA